MGLDELGKQLRSRVTLPPDVPSGPERRLGDGLVA